MSLRFRLNLLITALSLAGMLLAGWVVIGQTRFSIREGMEVSTRVTAQLLDNVITSAYISPELGFPPEVMKKFLLSLGYVRGNTITLYDIHNRVLYQSPPSTYKLEVNPPRWFIRLVSPEPEVLTRRTTMMTLVVESNPAGTIREAWDGFFKLMWIGMGFFVLLNGVVYFVLGQALRPVGHILQAISRMEQGDLSVRLPEFSLPEFHRIGCNLNRMAESLDRSTRENERLALVVRQTTDAVIIHDLEGNISFWNPAAERLFGYSAEQILGRSAAELSVPGNEDEFAQNLATIRARKGIEILQVQRRARDGRVLDVSLSASPLVDPHSGEVIGEVCIMRDITERLRAEKSERELEENRRLTQIIQKHVEEERRSLSRELHDELSQYVTAIKSFAVAITNKSHGKIPEIEAHAHTIAAAAEHIYDGMHNIIRQLRPGALDNLGLIETLRDAVANWLAQHPEVQFRLNFSGKLDSLGETLNINLYRIVQEGVTNALRYAKASEIVITLEEQSDGMVKVSIRDNGIGMHLCNVDDTNHFGLLGMRERVQALQGKFQLDSAPGEGTCITVYVPKASK